jgi:hypothetical protein
VSLDAHTKGVQKVLKRQKQSKGVTKKTQEKDEDSLF